MTRAFRLLFTVLLALASVAGLAACGGSNNESAQQLLKDTFGPNHPVKSGKLSVGLNLDAQGLQGLKGPVELRLSGPFASQGQGKLPKFDFNLALGTGGSSFTAGAVSTGDKGFLKVQGQTYAVTGQLFTQFKQGYEQASKSSGSKAKGPSFASLGINPLDWLRNPRKAGTETVGGAATTHVAASIDVPRFIEDLNQLLGKTGSLGQGAKLPSSLTAQQRKDIEASIKSATLDVWTGKDDKTLRRLKVTLGFDVPQSARKRAGGLQKGSATFDVTIADLNASQTISAPSNAKPLSELTSALGGIAGSGSSGGSSGAGSGSSGAGSGSAGGGSTTTVPAPPTAAGGSSQKYLDCLQKAGSDVSKIQKCAELLAQ